MLPSSLSVVARFQDDQSSKDMSSTCMDMHAIEDKGNGGIHNSCRPPNLILQHEVISWQQLTEQVSF